VKPRVLFLGGNGHAAVRLERVRAVLEQRGSPFDLIEIEYPGFEGRPRVGSSDDGLEPFLEAIEAEVERRRAGADTVSIHATGIGGLLFLALRARGRLQDLPAVLEGPVLWGLEVRVFPRLMRISPLLPRLLQRALSTSFARRRFLRQHLRDLGRDGEEFARRFFEGYARCEVFADFFRWLDPGFLRDLEGRLARRPEALQGLRFWVGEHDGVVGMREVELTAGALGQELDLRQVEGWGHYPMIEQPEAWVTEVARALA